jgi:hypothetical protein
VGATLPSIDPDRVRDLARGIVQSGVSAKIGVAERLRDAGDAFLRWFAALPAPARAVVLGTVLLLVAAGLRSLLFRRTPVNAPRQAHMRARNVWAALLLSAGLCAAAWFEARRAEELPTGAGSVLHAGSTLDATSRGASGLRVLLDRMGVRAKRLEHPWPPPRGVRVLVVLSPEEPPSAEELRALSAWVDRGGVVVLGLGTGPFGVTFGLDDAFGLALREVEVYGRVRTSFDSLTVETPAGRVLAGEGALPILASERGALCVRRKQGTGEIIACAGSYIFSNDGLLAADDAVFAVRLLANRGTIGFDEFHHGIGTRVDVPVLLAESPIGWALIQLAVAFVVLAWARAARPGAGLP